MEMSYAKACQLAASLQADAADVLQTLSEKGLLHFEMCSALEMCFSEKYMKEYSRLQLKTLSSNNKASKYPLNKIKDLRQMLRDFPIALFLAITARLWRFPVRLKLRKMFLSNTSCMHNSHA